MAHVVRPLWSCLRSSSRHRTCALAARPDLQQQKKKHLPYSTSPSSSTNFQSRGLRLLPSDDVQESSSDTETLDTGSKSRNQKKREARRAVQWGMELSTLSIPQIKLILRAASLDQEVFNALLLVKRFAPDVREGKRRQFNYIGRLLREVQPELMDDLIQASKDGDQSRLQELCAARESITEVDKEGEEETEFEEEEEGNILAVTSRWCAGLIDKDPDITNEVYSIYTIEFNRQVPRKRCRPWLLQEDDFNTVLKVLAVCTLWSPKEKRCKGIAPICTQKSCGNLFVQYNIFNAGTSKKRTKQRVKQHWLVQRSLSLVSYGHLQSRWNRS